MRIFSDLSYVLMDLMQNYCILIRAHLRVLGGGGGGGGGNFPGKKCSLENANM